MANKKRNKGGRKRSVSSSESRGRNPPIASDAEKEFLRLYADNKFTKKQASIVYKCSTSYARRMHRQLIEKGFMNTAQERVPISGTTPPTQSSGDGSEFRFWRIHACEYNVRIVFGQTGERYQRARKRSNCVRVQGFTIRLYARSLEIQDTNDYTSDKPEKASWKAWDAYFKIAVRIERDLGIIIVKERAQNVRRVQAHFARVNDEGAVVAVDQEDLSTVPIVYHNHDGKLRFKVDWSKGPPEAEFLHPVDGEKDSRWYEGFVQDGVEKLPPFTSEIANALQRIAMAQAHATEQLAEISSVSKVLLRDMEFRNRMMQSPDVAEGRPFYVG